MAVEILSVSLSDESIERLAQEVLRLMVNSNKADLATQSNPPSSQTSQGAERSGFQASDDPWLNSPDAQEQRPAVEQEQAPPRKFCKHGEMRFIPAGVSGNGKRYNAFYGCSLERGNPDQCRPVRP